MMNKKNLPHIITVTAFVVFIVLGLACMTYPETSQSASQSETQSSTTHKTTTNQNVYSFNYSEHNDGCLVRYESGYYHYRPGTYTTGYGGVKNQISPPEHRNDNAFVRAEINRFNSEITRLDAVPSDNQQEAFNNTPIGSWYFVYRVTQEYESRNYSFGVDEGIPLRETFVVYHCNIWKMNVVAGR